jgi:glucose-1-phosphate cytidylyltransferase
MKVVLFCGGLGMRLREYSDQIPKPMVPIGYRPVLWHVMKYYASFGHKDFVLCLGYKADVVKRYFLDYDECITNDFVLEGKSEAPRLLSSDIHDWKITFVDTGMHSNIGMRLLRARPHLEGEEMFLANYADGLSDFPLPTLVDQMLAGDKVAAFLSVRPPTTFHLVRTTKENVVTSIRDIRETDIRINGGYFVLRSEIFDYLREGEELVLEPFSRLIEKEKLIAHPYDGFWASMDTFKDKQQLDELYARDAAPWEVWKRREGSGD